MSDKSSHKKTARALRIYEYEDEDGIVFWSFAFLPGRNFKRLTLADNRGKHYRQVVSDIHSMAFQSELLEEDDG